MGHRGYNKNGELIEDIGIREMRADGVYPTVTSVIRMLASPYLELWKQKNAVSIALELTDDEREGESKDIIERVMIAGKQIAIDAADRGTEIHRGAEAIMLGQAWNQDDPQLVAINEWKDANIIEVDYTEKVLLNHEIGYGGTADLKADHQQSGRTVIDLKSQNCKPGANGKPRANFYPAFVLQLAAYAAVEGGGIPVASLIVDKNSPTVFEKLWTEEQVAAAFEAFKCLHGLWCWSNRYWPGNA